MAQERSKGPRVNPSEERILIGPTEIRFLATGGDSNGSVAVFEMSVPAGHMLTAPPHSHDGYEETIYGAEGTLTWTVDGETVDVGRSQALCIPRGAVHSFANHGDQDAKALVVVSPAAIGPDFFRESAVVINAGGPPDRSKLVEIMLRHGLSPAPPAHPIQE